MDVITNNNMKEVWKNINEGYQVSSLGKVRSLPVKGYIDSSGRKRSKKGCILKFGTRSDGYYIVNISNYKHRRTWKVHQLVAEVFIPNPENKPCINHKNGVKTDNRVDNLEWATHKENTQHAFKVLKVKPTTLYGANNAASKKVIDNKTGQVFESIAAAAKHIGMKSPTLRAMLGGFNRNKTDMALHESRS